MKSNQNQRLKGLHAKRSEDALYSGAKRYALKLLSYRSRSRKEMIERLQRKGFGTNEISRVIDSLENAGLVRDETLARGLLKNAKERRYLGKRGIKILLAKRGIERELINETLSGFTEDMEEESALRLVEKKFKALRAYPEDTIKQRLWRLLERKGFSTHIINTALKAKAVNQNVEKLGS